MAPKRRAQPLDVAAIQRGQSVSKSRVWFEPRDAILRLDVVLSTTLLPGRRQAGVLWLTSRASLF